MPTPSVSSKPSTPSTWRARVDAWARSGLSARAFAEQHGLKPDTLYHWRRRLRIEDRSTPSPPPRLVPVHLEAPSVCELAFGDGRVLRFPASLAPEVLRGLLAVLGSP